MEKELPTPEMKLATAKLELLQGIKYLLNNHQRYTATQAGIVINEVFEPRKMEVYKLKDEETFPLSKKDWHRILDLLKAIQKNEVGHNDNYHMREVQELKIKEDVLNKL